MLKSQFSKLLSLAVLLLASCSTDDYTYSNRHCNLYIDNSRYVDPVLSSAMNAMSPGVFCEIKISGNRYFFSSNQGQSSQKNMNEEDRRRGGRAGMNNGVIVGYGNLADGAFFAYDAECPNCFDFDAIPLRSYPVTMNTAGIATCEHCKRQYNMNTGGNCTNNTGRGLTQYRATTTGTLGRLFIN